IIGNLCNTKSLANLSYPESTVDEAGAVIFPEGAIKYGNFIMLIIDFLIVAFCMFLVIRMFMKMREKAEARKKAEEVAEVVEEAPAEPTVEEKTLETLKEIKELLEKNNKE
ncbi:MAG: MscL family protein, partial [Clostridia bacterium]|nr:MscL family protein [Clostridia bacterium]